MAKVTNNTVNALHLPDGSVLPTGQEVEVAGWGKIKAHHVLSGLVEQGLLAVSEDADDGQDDTEVLRAKLKKLGIEIGPNAKVETLQKRLAEAEGKAKADAIAKLKEKGIQVGDDVTLEELQAELAQHQ